MANEIAPFTDPERRAALVTLTAQFLALRPSKYPPNAQGEQKPVAAGGEAFAAAVWGKFALQSIERSIMPRAADAPAQKGGATHAPSY